MAPVTDHQTGDVPTNRTWWDAAFSALTDAWDLTDASMASAVILAEWYLDEAARLQSACRTNAALLKAQALLDWLRMQGSTEVSFSDVLQLGPSATRIKKKAEAALEILKAHGWIEEVSSRPRTVRVLRVGAVQ